MATIGYHASHEQFRPGELLGYVRMAETAGFAAAMCSDHIMPWSERQGESGFAWSWLGSALEATRLSYGVVNAPGQRYNPAIIAQAVATLDDMYPGRFWLAVGSGENINEHITGEAWPPKAERNARLKEAVDVMRALWAGEMVSHRGHFNVVEARLYTVPKTTPLVVGAALSPETAEWLAGWADALITVSRAPDEQKQVIEAWRRGGGENKPMYVQAKLSYAETDDDARQGAFEQWRTNVFASTLAADLRFPAQYDAAAKYVRPEDMDAHVRISSDISRHIGWLEDDLALGFERILLHNVNCEQQRFIETFGEKVIPALRQATA